MNKITSLAHSELDSHAKIVNILGGYGYETKLASMEDCVKSAEKGLVI